MMKSRLNCGLVPELPKSMRLAVESSITLSDGTLAEPDLAVWDRGMLPRQVGGPNLLLAIEVADSSIGYICA